jgi:hypothetical protein
MNDRLTVRPDQIDPIPDITTTYELLTAALRTFRPIEERLTCGAPKIAAILVVEHVSMAINLLREVANG